MEEEKKEVEIKESDLDALYFYVEMNFDSMNEGIHDKDKSYYTPTVATL